MEPIKDVLVPIGTSIIGAILGVVGTYWFTVRYDRKKAAVERAIKKIDDHLKACMELKLFLMEWYNEIGKAITFEESPDKTLAKLEDFIDKNHFENLLTDKVRELQDEPLCEDLIKKANFYKEEALGKKGVVRRGLADAVERHRRFSIYNFYGWRKDGVTEAQARGDRRVVMDYLSKLYEDFENELNMIIPRIKDKRDQIEQSL
jgi:hypothetical protein